MKSLLLVPLLLLMSCRKDDTGSQPYESIDPPPTNWSGSMALTATDPLVYGTEGTLTITVTTTMGTWEGGMALCQTSNEAGLPNQEESLWIPASGTASLTMNNTNNGDGPVTVTWSIGLPSVELMDIIEVQYLPPVTATN